MLKQCAICGTQFKVTKDRKKYCSVACARAAKIKPKNYKICPICGNSFLSKNNNQTYCSRKCHGASRRTYATHPDTKRLYVVWKNMIRRCEDVNCKLYGGRGIKVCSEWRSSFITFYNWSIANGYDKNAARGKCTIDRINNNGNYEPSNCRWVDMQVQNNNKRSNHIIEINGETKTLAEWCRYYKVPLDVIVDRVNIGWSYLKAFTFPIKSKYKLITYKGESKSISDWCKIYNLSCDTFKYRLSKGWSLEDIFEVPFRFDYQRFVYKGKSKCIKEWAKEYNLSSLLLYKNILAGIPPERIFQNVNNSI